MNKIILTFLTVALINLPLSSAVLTVDNNPGSVAMYSGVQAAINAADPGDTILIAASPTFYGDFNIYKQLHFIGTGYFKSSNGIAGLNTHTSWLYLRFKKDNSLGDSTGSSVTGTQGYLESQAGVTLTVDKCFNDGHNWDFNGPTTVTRTYSRSWIILKNAASSISNSITRNLRLQAGGVTATNCVIREDITGSASGTNFTNCIFLTTNAGHWTGVPTFDYCINIGGSFLPTSATNTNGALLADVIRGAGSAGADQYYELSEGSIAIGAGLNGDDIGAYGGDNPYMLSGMPGRPVITRFSLPPTATGLTAVTVEVEAEAHPE